MSAAEYPKVTSKVEITFVDGEVKTYFIDASPKSLNYLTREASETGFLVLWKGGHKRWSIPVAQIREIEVTAEGVAE